MKSILFRKLLLLAAFITLFTDPFTEAAAAKESTQMNVEDSANIFSDYDEELLTAECQKVWNSRKTHIAIITTNSIEVKSNQTFLEDYYDAHCASQKYKATVLVLINMDPNARGIEIQGYGIAEQRLSDKKIDLILDKMVPKLKNGNYYSAVSYFVSQVDTYMMPPFYLQTWFLLITALAIGGITIAIMTVQSGGSVTVNQGTYLDNGDSRILAKRDHYLRTTVSKRRKPQQTNQSGGSGGGRSSGGHSHSGGGRSF